MSMPRMIVAAAVLTLSAPVFAQTYGVGKPATEREIAGWNIDVTPDGKGLPPGRGSVAQGKQVYDTTCAACHGAKGEGKPADRLVGGIGSLTTSRRIKTVGSFWPYATTLFDYIRRAMPYYAPGSLSVDDTFAVTAYILNLNGIIPDDLKLDQDSLPKVKMPNRDGFFTDPELVGFKTR